MGGDAIGLVLATTPLSPLLPASSGVLVNHSQSHTEQESWPITHFCLEIHQHTARTHYTRESGAEQSQIQSEFIFLEASGQNRYLIVIYVPIVNSVITTVY